MLVYRLDELEEELVAFRHLCADSDFLMDSSELRLQALLQQLADFQSSKSTSTVLAVTGEEALLTQATSVWLLDRTQVAAAARIELYMRLSRVHDATLDLVEVRDASVLIEISRPQDRSPVKRLRFGWDTLPSGGLHFNVVELSANVVTPLMPSTLASPFAALEVAMCELFPTAWASAVLATPDGHDWRVIQRRRLSKLNQWVAAVVSGTQSPWVALRSARPFPRILV